MDDSSIATAVVDSATSVDEAVAWAVAVCKDEHPSGAGIDTFMCWSTGRSGWRGADRHLRAKYPQVKPSVLSSNSAYGAMSIQGMALAMRLREWWPNLTLNETHPKVLYHALAQGPYLRGDISPMTKWLQSLFDPVIDCDVANEHQWDALISAWATWQGSSGRWSRDLVANGTRLIFPAGRVTYFWPE